MHKWGKFRQQKNWVFLAKWDVGKGKGWYRGHRLPPHPPGHVFWVGYILNPASQLFSNWLTETVKPHGVVLTLTESFPQ